MSPYSHDSVSAGQERRARFSRSPSPTIRLTDDDRLIIRHVGRHRFLRSTHLVQLFPDRSPRKLRERLCELYHAGYLDRPRAQINYFSLSGSTPIVYALGNRGAEIFSEIAHTPPPENDWTDKNRDAKRPYIEHALLLADLMTVFESTSLDHEGIEFINADSLLAIVPEQLRHTKNPWTLIARLRHGGAHHTIPVIPDAVFALQYGNDAHSGRMRPAVPIENDQSFRLIATTHSGRKRPGCGRWGRV